MRRLFAVTFLTAGFGLLALGPSCPPPVDEVLSLPGLTAPVRVVRDERGTPHIEATTLIDAYRVQGFLHARGRLFQMDQTRRQVSGDLAELLGAGSLASDVQFRIIGLRRAAERTLARLEAEFPEELLLLEAYAEGVNHFIATEPLPIQYAELFLTQVRPWSVLDTLAIGKGLAAQLSLDTGDPGRTDTFDRFAEAGEAGGFDGLALLIEDLRRFAPMDPATTVLDADGTRPFFDARRRLPSRPFLADAAESARRFEARMEGVALAEWSHLRDEYHGTGSNEWGVTAAHSTSGTPIVANDPHLGLDIPTIFYENHILVPDDATYGRVNVSGMTFPGVPAVILGQNEHVTWGATTNSLDVTDFFRERVVALGSEGCPSREGTDFPIDPETGKPIAACIVSGGEAKPVVIEDQPVYLVNRSDPMSPDNLEDSGITLLDAGGLVLTIPSRSDGPIVDIDDPFIIFGGEATSALSIQYTGFSPTLEVIAFLRWNLAKDLDEFVAGLQFFDVGSQNWAVADTTGRLGYFASAEIPLREDLEAGIPGMPFLVRDGVSGDENWIPDATLDPTQAVPFEVLPFAEMPQTIDPENGFFANANNDPTGATLDNDPLNQLRTSGSGAIYYLAANYSNGLRAGRITQLLRDRIEAGLKISIDDMKRFQSNVQQRDAELLIPFLAEAFDRAGAAGAAPEVASLAADPGVAEAVERLRRWDFTAATGIPEGWDRHDSAGTRLPIELPSEIENSVATTLYNLWRGQLIRRVIDDRLAAISQPGRTLGVGSSNAVKTIHNLLVTWPIQEGVGLSGVDFFPEPAGLARADRRDLALLRAVRDALDRAASPALADAFGESTDQDDYRWGKLHRITFDNPLGSAFEVPPGGGFGDLSAALDGIPRDGGYEVVNASSFGARGQSIGDFRFSSGPVRRYVGSPGASGDPLARVLGFNVYPGGPTSDPSDPFYVSQLRHWLTADHFPVAMRERDYLRGAIRVEQFEPVLP